jgi:type I restriction-modification system DNA methylase subunit
MEKEEEIDVAKEYQELLNLENERNQIENQIKMYLDEISKILK